MAVILGLSAPVLHTLYVRKTLRNPIQEEKKTLGWSAPMELAEVQAYRLNPQRKARTTRKFRSKWDPSRNILFQVWGKRVLSKWTATTAAANTQRAAGAMIAAHTFHSSTAPCGMGPD